MARTECQRIGYAPGHWASWAHLSRQVCSVHHEREGVGNAQRPTQRRTPFSAWSTSLWIRTRPHWVRCFSLHIPIPYVSCLPDPWRAKLSSHECMRVLQLSTSMAGRHRPSMHVRQHYEWLVLERVRKQVRAFEPGALRAGPAASASLRRLVLYLFTPAVASLLQSYGFHELPQQVPHAALPAVRATHRMESAGSLVLCTVT